MINFFFGVFEDGTKHEQIFFLVFMILHVIVNTK